MKKTFPLSGRCAPRVASILAVSALALGLAACGKTEEPTVGQRLDSAVEKTERAGCPMLVTISAPTSRAAERAAQAGLTLVTLARADSALVVSDPHGLIA